MQGPKYIKTGKGVLFCASALTTNLSPAVTGWCEAGLYELVPQPSTQSIPHEYNALQRA